MLLTRYARRNLTRHPGRSALTAVAIISAVALMVLGTTLLDGLIGHMMGEYALQTGHVRVRHKEYDRQSRFEPLDYTVDRVGERAEKLEALPEVTGALPRLRYGLMLQFTDTSTIVPESAGIPEEDLTDEQIFGKKTLELGSAIGIDSARERSRMRLEGQLISGSWFTAGNAKEIILGKQLAERLGVTVGKDLELVSFRDGLRDTSARVAGIFDSGNDLMNRLAYTPLPLAQDLLGLPDQATELMVFGHELFESKKLATALRASGTVEGLALTEWNQIGLMRTASGIFGVVFGALLGAILVVSVAGLLNTMLMNVLERRREIGVLLALGLSRRRVILAILSEAVFLAVVGAAIGATVGIAASLYLVHHGIELGGDTKKLPIAVGNIVYGRLTTVNVVRAVLLGGVTALVGALWPAWKASALSPVEAMRKR
jgi:putative ABC transport system permease protein